MLLVTWYHLIYLTLLVRTLSVVKYECNGHHIDFYQYIEIGEPIKKQITKSSI